MTVGTSRIFPLKPDIGDAADFQIAGSGVIIGSATDGLGGMEGFNCQVRFMLGTGSGGCRVYIQSSLDQGSSWFNIAVTEFDVVSVPWIFAVRTATTGLVTPVAGASGNSPETTGVITSVLGDRLRAYIIVSGTYVNTTLSVRVMPI